MKNSQRLTIVAGRPRDFFAHCLCLSLTPVRLSSPKSDPSPARGEGRKAPATTSGLSTRHAAGFERCARRPIPCRLGGRLQARDRCPRRLGILQDRRPSAGRLPGKYQARLVPRHILGADHRVEPARQADMRQNRRANHPRAARRHGDRQLAAVFLHDFHHRLDRADMIQPRFEIGFLFTRQSGGVERDSCFALEQISDRPRRPAPST